MSYLKSPLLIIFSRMDVWKNNFLQMDVWKNKEKSSKTPWKCTSKVLEKSLKKACHDLWEPCSISYKCHSDQAKYQNQIVAWIVSILNFTIPLLLMHKNLASLLLHNFGGNDKNLQQVMYLMYKNPQKFLGYMDYLAIFFQSFGWKNMETLVEI